MFSPVHCTIQEIMLLAQAKWNTPLTLTTIAFSIDVNMNILSRLKNNRTSLILATTLGRLCNYFWCQPGELLVVASTHTGRHPETVVRRPAYPSEQIKEIPIISSIPTLLRGHSPTKIANSADLSRTAVYALMEGKAMERINLSTLAGLCNFLQVDVDSLLRADLPIIE